MRTPDASPKLALKAHWASAAKVGVGTALTSESPTWFTLSHGIVTEVFYPFVDTACIRGMGFIVTDGRDFFSDELHDVESQVTYLADGVPAFEMINRCRVGRYEIEKMILSDPRRPVLLQKTRFRALAGPIDHYALHVLVAPHLDNQGADNTACLGEFKGIPMLFAKHDSYAMALACSAGWLRRAVGFADESDGLLGLREDKSLRSQKDRVEHGNVLMCGQIDLSACDGQFVLALAFGRDQNDAAHRARASIAQGFEAARTEYVHGWQNWQSSLLAQKRSEEHAQNIYQISAAVMRTHESKRIPGGIVASLTVPWGATKGDQDKGYHLVWPRDMIQTVSGLLAVRGHADARRVLFFLQVTQEADGHWPQNMFLNGIPSWNGIQLDETALVILLIDLAQREGTLSDDLNEGAWEMIRRAAGYLVCHGPKTPMDRWEEQSGYAASTMAVEISALLAAAAMAAKRHERKMAAYLRETADIWNSEIDSLIYVRGTQLARDAGVDGYYARFALPNQRQSREPAAGLVALKNQPVEGARVPAADVVSVDALALVRFGLRGPDDPRIVNTVRVIDQLLKVETPFGPGWHRYNHDGYGEHADGSPFDGTGIGRLWPLLTGERGHYEVAAGRFDEVRKLLRTMEGFANASGLIPEQVWDSPDIPEHQLKLGRPSGSAMPLVWAHAEYCKLRRSVEDHRVFDMPVHTVERYLQKRISTRRTFWRFEQPCEWMAAGHTLRIEVLNPARVHWSCDRWKTVRDDSTADTGLGIHYVDLPVEEFPTGATVQFTFYWTEASRWEGEDFEVRIEAGHDAPAPQPQATKTTASTRPNFARQR